MRAKKQRKTRLNPITTANLRALMADYNLSLNDLLDKFISEHYEEARRPKKSHTKMILESGMVGMVKGKGSVSENWKDDWLKYLEKKHGLANAGKNVNR